MMQHLAGRRLVQRCVNYVRRRLQPGSYFSRMAGELAIYRDCTDVHALPRIADYWANKFLRPKLEPFGFTSPEDAFLQLISAEAGRRGFTRVLSIGAGNCDTEVRIAGALAAQGHRVEIHCMDVNRAMLKRGAELAARNGVDRLIKPLRHDFNAWDGGESFDVIMANQSLHHVLRLEHLFDAVQRSLADKGVFVISDMIGRNGHQRWPEAKAIVDQFWQELPVDYRYNLQLRRLETTFMDWDCSVGCFEGIRSQDILPLLVERFDFDVFVPFANVVDPFIDRAFGHHFDPDREWDRDFIDRVHHRDEVAIARGEITPTHVVAVMPKGRPGKRLWPDRLTPGACVRNP